MKGASFTLVNDRGEVVVGGREEMAAFDNGRETWRVRCPPPGRGLLRTIGAIAARAASLYFRFGGVAATAFRGFQVARLITSFSWSGLATRSSFANLQSLATNLGLDAARSSASNRFKAFGVAARVRSRLANPTADVRSAVRDRLIEHRPRNVDERLLDRLDPARQLERLSKFLWHQDRMATLRGNWMYFYTDLKRSDGHGLAGINIHTGIAEREIRLSDLDERFVTDEVAGMLFVGNGNRLMGYSISR